MNAPLRVPTRTRTLLMPHSFSCVSRVYSRTSYPWLLVLTIHGMPKRSTSMSRRFAGARGSPPFVIFEGWDSARRRIKGLSRLCSLTAHLLHELAHCSDVTRRAGFTPGLVALRSLFQVGEVAIHFETFPRLRDNRLGLLPITEHHPGKCAAFRSGCRDSHGVVEGFHEIVFEEPIASLAQPGLAAHII